MLLLNNPRLRTKISVNKQKAISFLLSSSLLALPCQADNLSATPSKKPLSINESAVPARSAALQDLITLILGAYGGAEKLKEIDALAMRAKGKVKEFSSISNAENDFDCNMVSKGDKLRIEMSVLGQQMITGYDGQEGWMQQGDVIYPTDPASVERIKEEIKHSLEHELLDLLDEKSVVEQKGTKELNGKICDVLTIKVPDEQLITLYVDQITHLVARSEFQGVDAEQGVPAKITNDFLDYRLLLGTMEPFRVIEYTNDKKTTEATQETTENDVTITDDFFRMPKQKILARLAQGPVQFPFEYAYNQILVKAKINGDKEATFIVDSGASQSMLDKTFATTVGLPLKSNFSVTTGGGSMHMDYLVAKTVQLGDLTLDNIGFGVTEGAAFTQMQPGNRPAGLFGANVLKQFLIKYDFVNRTITLSDPHEVQVPENAVVIPTKPAMGNLGIVIEGELDGKVKIPFLVDTGAAFNHLSGSLIKPILNERLLTVSKILGLDGQQVDVGAVRLQSLKLGGLLIDQPVFSVAADTKGSGIIGSTTLGILGNPLWSLFSLTLDYRHNRIFLERSPLMMAISQTESKLHTIRVAFHRNNDYKTAIQACVKLFDSPDAQKYADASALVHSEIGMLLIEQALFSKQKTSSHPGDKNDNTGTAPANSLAEKKPLSKEDDDAVEKARKEFELAESQATERGVKAKMYARFARRMSELDPSLLPKARTMLDRALKLAPMDSDVLISAAILLRKQASTAVIESVADQALSADPANWDALWFRYNLAKEQAERNNLSLIEAQLRRYYPGAAQVVELGKVNAILPKAGNAATTKELKPSRKSKVHKTNG